MSQITKKMKSIILYYDFMQKLAQMLNVPTKGRHIKKLKSFKLICIQTESSLSIRKCMNF